MWRLWLLMLALVFSFLLQTAASSSFSAISSIDGQPNRSSWLNFHKTAAMQSHNITNIASFRHEQQQPPGTIADTEVKVVEPYILATGQDAAASNGWYARRIRLTPVASGATISNNIDDNNDNNVDNEVMNNSEVKIPATTASTSTTSASTTRAPALQATSTATTATTTTTLAVANQLIDQVKEDPMHDLLEVTFEKMRRWFDPVQKLFRCTEGDDDQSLLSKSPAPDASVWTDEIQARSDYSTQRSTAIAMDASVGRGRKKKKLKKKLTKLMLPLLLAYKLKFVTLVPVLIGGLALLVGSTGLAGFFFALFTMVAATGKW